MQSKTDFQLPDIYEIINEKVIYNYDEVDKVLDHVRKYFRFSWSNQDCKYYDVPVTFDIETSNTYSANNEKMAFMYIWQFCLYGAVVIGRTWEEYQFFIGTLAKKLDLGEKKRLIVYVENLEFEFQFMRKWFSWTKVFSGDSRDVMQAITTQGIEYRCSYKLSGYSLETIGKNLVKYKRKKLVGNLDYNKIRHSETQLTESELDYCVEDVKVLVCYIAELIETHGGIAKLPLTKTGFARTKCRNACFYELKNGKVDRKNGYKRKRYREFIKSLSFDPDEFDVVDNAYAGGFVHGNPFYYGKLVECVDSFDLTSDYTSQAIKNHGFPMSKGERYTPIDFADFKKQLELYACVFTIELRDLEPIVFHEYYISKSKCQIVENETVYNGRIIRADRIVISITEVDYGIIERMYTWNLKKMKVIDFYRYRRGYLPTDLVKTFLELYKNKTTLKNVIGMETEYLNSKEILNSASYGMFVTNPIREENEYLIDENRWPETDEVADPDIESQIQKYNNSPGRFSFFLWGVYISAFARRDLLNMILKIHPQDYLYCDTDSIKLLHAEKYRKLFEGFNLATQKMLEMACDYHKIDVELLKPKTVKGVEKPLGVWDFDGHYARFKFNRAKCYAFQYSFDPRNDPKIQGHFGITVAGLGKKSGAQFLAQGWGYDLEGNEINNPFDKFTTGLYVPPHNTGKLTHAYLDGELKGKIVDYLGNEGGFHELSAVHLAPCDFSMSIADKITGFIREVIV